MKSVTTPDWLARHGAQLVPSKDGHSWLVHLGKEPQYLLMAVPVKGSLGCQVTQTINGRRLDSGAAYPSIDAALNGGLEELRKALGW